MSIRPFLDSTAHLDDAPELQRRMKRDGYLFIRGLIPREVVLDVRRKSLELADAGGWLDKAHPIQDGVTDNSAACVDPEPIYLKVVSEIYKLEGLHAIQHHENVIGLFERLLEEPVLPRPRLIPRSFFPQKPEYTTSPHQDYPYVQGTAEAYTMWAPLHDCPISMGALQVAEASHLNGVMEFKLSEHAATALEVADPLDGKWVSADFEAGDVVIFHSLTVHKGSPNLSNRLRQSADFRFQRASDPITEASCRPFVTALTWEEIYKDWKSDKLQYYWQKPTTKLVEYDMKYFNQRDERAFAMAEAGDEAAKHILLRITQNDLDPAKRERAAALIARLEKKAA